LRECELIKEIPQTTTTTQKTEVSKGYQVKDTTDVRELARDAADRYRIPREIFFALIKQESGWNSRVIGAAGEVGLTQVMPYHWNKYYSFAEYRDNPQAQLEFGAQILARHYYEFQSWEKALISYNAGASRARSGKVPASTKRYVKNIMEAYR